MVLTVYVQAWCIPPADRLTGVRDTADGRVCVFLQQLGQPVKLTAPGTAAETSIGLMRVCHWFATNGWLLKTFFYPIMARFFAATFK